MSAYFDILVSRRNIKIRYSRNKQMKQIEIQQIKQRFGIIGNDESLNRAIDTAVRVAPTDLSVLITGESGVGKESFPRILHAYSYRKHGAYIAVNCGAIPEGTIDSELFGHEKGSFTGATSDRKGYFEVADGGTIFLDEVGELPMATQVRLLRVLETGEFIKVGSSKTIKTDVRVVAATNLNIPQAIKKERFREDLYYRLNTVAIHVLPLRNRKEDIQLLFRKFAADFSEKYNMPPIKLDERAKKRLADYYWRGNVRQLKNITEQISVIEQKRDITEEVLKEYLPQDTTERLPAIFNSNPLQETKKEPSSEREVLYQILLEMKQDVRNLRAAVDELQAGKKTTEKYTQYDFSPVVIQKEELLQAPSKTHYSDYYESNQSPKIIKNRGDFQQHIQDVEEYDSIEEVKSLADMEKKMILRALDKHNGKRKPAADELQISERTLYRKIKEYKIDA